MKVRLSGQGDAPLSGTGPAGDLYVSINVTPHPQFRREGSDIWVDVPISLTTAVLGGTARVPTVDGDVELKIPAGAQPEERKVLRRRGVQEVGKPDGERGDQWVVLKVQIPKTVSEKGKELLAEFGRVEEGRTGSSSAGSAKKSSSSEKKGASSSASSSSKASKEAEEDKDDKGFLRSAFESLKKNLKHEEGKEGGKDKKDKKDDDPNRTSRVEA